MERYQPDTEFRAIGCDQISYQGEQLIVFAAVEMPDWYVKKYRKLAIYFEGRKYFVADKTVLSDKKTRQVRYCLQPWPDDLNDLAGGTIEYDENYVEARDQALAQLERERYGNLLLLPFEPLIGFLPSSLKQRLQNDFAVDAFRATNFSIYLEYIAIFALIALLVVCSFTTAFNVVYLIVATLMLLPDALIRYDNMMKDGEIAYGFYEWLFHLKLT